MIYITGDTHRDFSRIYKLKKDSDNMLILLGDVGINYYLNEEDKNCKEYLKKLKLKLFCVRGNHEERPENISTYKEVEMFGGKVFIEEEYPNLVFAKDGETYNIDGKKILVIGGAYSVDKQYRLLHGYEWFKDEQLTEIEMDNILNKIKGMHFDIVLTHTCPYKYEPREVFIRGLEQTKVDKLEFMFGRVKIFNKDEYVPRYDRNGYEIVRDAYSQNEVMKEEIKCPKCNSKNISVLKGDGFSIIGADYIAIICNDCKKVYGFNDVKYKPNCSKEL